MGMIGYFAEIDSEKINQLLESTEKPLMDNIHDTLSGLRRLDIDKRWDFLHFGLTAPLLLIPRRMIR
ncbi:DUF1877 family protein [Escherichia coli]|nr:DUF1877 family protein [Escherichia coli]